MGSIIKFPTAPVVRKTTSLRAAAGAQILFFTGVRYERHEEPAATRRARSRRPLRKKISAQAASA